MSFIILLVIYTENWRGFFLLYIPPLTALLVYKYSPIWSSKKKLFLRGRLYKWKKPRQFSFVEN
jgi:hypothetical protein